MTVPLHPAWDELDGPAPVFDTVRQFKHPSMPGVTVERTFQVIAPTEAMAHRTAHVHFMLALSQLGIHFDPHKRRPAPPE